MKRNLLIRLLVAVAIFTATAGVLARYRAADHGPPAYQFVVTPGNDPATLRLDFPDARMVEVDRAGDLFVRRGDTATRAGRPRAYQHIDGVRREVEVRFVLDARGDVRFALGSYDRRQSLVISPQP